jgi:pyruvate formate lyase activating enzyme
LLASGVDCEFRTTWHAGFLSTAELELLTQTLADLGVRRYALQEFRASAGPAVRAEGSAAAADLQALARRFPGFSVRWA